jgi:hypothetical protein
MAKVGTWVFDHNGLRGEVDRGDVTWTFADDGTMTIEDTDETRRVTYSLTKYCGGYGKIAERDVAYLKVESGEGEVGCYIIGHVVEVGPAEGKVLALDSDRGNRLYLIPATDEKEVNFPALPRGAFSDSFVIVKNMPPGDKRSQ